MILVFPSIMNSIRKTENGLNEAGEKLLYSSASLYIDSNQMNYPLEEGNSYCIRVSDLLESKKLESINLIKGLKETDRIEVNVVNKEYTYRLNNHCSMYLKDRIEQDSNHIVMNAKVNGETVNKVIGPKTQKYTMKNYLWYAGQLWQVLETNDNNHTIKLITAHPLTSIAYGEISDWNSSWVYKWLHEVFYNSLEGTSLVANTKFCLDNIVYQGEFQEDILYVNSHTPISTCQDEIIDTVGLMTFEDYVYANDGKNPIYTGGSFIDDDNYTWVMNSFDETHMWVTWYEHPSMITVTNNDRIGYVKSYGHGVRPVISIRDNAHIISGEGSKTNPYVLLGEQIAPKDSQIASVKVGDYIYLDESNNPNKVIEEVVARGVNYQTTKDKIRYRVVKKNTDGTVKVERADILRNLPSTISNSKGHYVPFYYKESTDTSGCFLDSTTNTRYNSGCSNYNYFRVDGNTQEYNYKNGIPLGDFLNSSSNSFYSWYSEKTKNMILRTTYHRYTSGYMKDYSNLNVNPIETEYPNRTDDGDITTYVVLPTWGEMYTGDDIGYGYWYMNRITDGIYHLGSGVSDNGFGTDPYLYNNWLGVRPIVTLKPNVIIKEGKGTMTDPYQLSL